MRARAGSGAGRASLAAGLFAIGAAACAAPPDSRCAVQEPPEVLQASVRDAQEPGSGSREGRAPGTAGDAAGTGPRSGPGAAAPSALERALQKLQLYGDLRLRHESSFRLDGADDRNRERIRLRLGVNYQLNDEVLIGARVATGDPDDPRSTHVTLGDVFDSLDVSLDRAFLTYEPTCFEGARVTAGKSNHPFYRNPVYGELLFDADVQPEGAVASYTYSEDTGAFEELSLAVGEYVILEQSVDDEASAFVAQASGRASFSDSLSGTLALGYYHYSSVTPDGSLAILGDNSGNATVDTDGDEEPDDFASDFGILNPIVSLDYSGWELPVVLGAEYIQNTRADIDGDTG